VSAAAQPNNWLQNALHGRKDAHNAAIGAAMSLEDGRTRCPDCGMTRFPRNWYQKACYCGHQWSDPYAGLIPSQEADDSQKGGGNA
jgi:hypothetical protein